MSLSFLDKSKGDLDKYIYWGIGFILFCLAAFKPIGLDRDSLAYIGAYYGREVSGLEESMEVTFGMISNAIRYTIDIPEAVFFVYALLTIPLKLFALQKLTPLWYLSLVILLCHYFILQDMTQIRANVVVAIFLFAILLLANGKRLAYSGMILVAAFFHISALALLPLVVLDNKPLNKWWIMILAAIPVVGYLFFFMKIDTIMVSLIPYVQDKIEVYEKLRDKGVIGDEINVFDRVFVLKLLIYYLLLFKHKVIEENYKYAPILFRICPFFFFFFCALGFLPVLASRVADLFGVAQILLIPCAVYTVKPDWTGKLVVCLTAVYFLFVDLVYSQLLNFDY